MVVERGPASETDAPQPTVTSAQSRQRPEPVFQQPSGGRIRHGDAPTRDISRRESHRALKRVRFQLTLIGPSAGKNGRLTGLLNDEQIESAVKGSMSTSRHSAKSFGRAEYFSSYPAPANSSHSLSPAGRASTLASRRRSICLRPVELRTPPAPPPSANDFTTRFRCDNRRGSAEF